MKTLTKTGDWSLGLLQAVLPILRTGGRHIPVPWHDVDIGVRLFCLAFALCECIETGKSLFQLGFCLCTAAAVATFGCLGARQCCLCLLAEKGDSDGFDLVIAAAVMAGGEMGGNASPAEDLAKCQARVRLDPR
ncbi:unnamed protein product [Tilletia controversa]|nr:unnamed protein product [Tilletia controversa]